MNVILIALGVLIAGIVIAIVAYFREDKWQRDVFEDILAPAFGLGGLLLLATSIFLGISMFWHTDGPHYPVRYELKAVSDGVGSTGAFFLGSGGFSDSPNYTYYVKNPDGSYSRQILRASLVKVFEDSETGGWLSATCRDSNWGLSDWGLNAVSGKCWDYEFHVPPGTVTDVIEMENK